MPTAKIFHHFLHTLFLLMPITAGFTVKADDTSLPYSTANYQLIKIGDDQGLSSLTPLWEKALNNSDASAYSNSMAVYGNTLYCAWEKKNADYEHVFNLRRFNLADGEELPLISCVFPQDLDRSSELINYNTRSIVFDDNGELLVFFIDKTPSYIPKSGMVELKFYLMPFDVASGSFDVSRKIAVTGPAIVTSQTLLLCVNSSPVKNFHGSFASGNFSFELMYPGVPQNNNEAIIFSVSTVNCINGVCSLGDKYWEISTNEITGFPDNSMERIRYDIDYARFSDKAPYKGSIFVNMPGTREVNKGDQSNNVSDNYPRIFYCYNTKLADDSPVIETVLPREERLNFNDTRMGISRIDHNGHKFALYANSYGVPQTGCQFTVLQVDDAKSLSDMHELWKIPADNMTLFPCRELSDVTGATKVASADRYGMRQLAAQTTTAETANGDKYTDMALYVPGSAVGLYRLSTSARDETSSVSVAQEGDGNTELTVEGSNLLIRNNASQPQSVSVYNIMGHELKRQTMPSNGDCKIDCGTCAQGIYIVKIGSSSKKIVLR